MKVLVATRQTQGSMAGDYCFTVEGELVTPLVVECASPDRCGCGRGFPGLASNRATTTAMVVELAHLDHEGLGTALRDSLQRGGWLIGLDDVEIAEEILDHIDAIEEACAGRPIGTVVRRRGDRVLAGRRAA